MRWICLDIGETLINETRVWTEWARVLGVTPFTLLASIGATVALRQDYQRVFDLVRRPDWRDTLPAFRAAYGGFRADDLYPDVLGAVADLASAGYRIAILGNQPAERSAELRALGVNPEVMAMSAEMGLAKPDPAFFARALELMGNPLPGDVAYVGDRLDNDVRPAVAAGMRAVWVRRGPWGAIGDSDGPPPETALIVHSLSELVERVGEIWPAQAGVGA